MISFLVETGDKLVADARLLESNDLSTDESSLTGEKAFRQQRRQILSVPGPTSGRTQEHAVFRLLCIKRYRKSSGNCGEETTQSLDRSQKNYLLLKKILHLFRKNWTAWEK